MMGLATLIDAATLKGYLLATDAPREVIKLAEQTVAGIMEVLARPGLVSNEEVRIPLPDAEMIKSIMKASETVPSRSEDRFAEEPASFRTEMPQAEESTPIAAIEVVQKDERASVTTVALSGKGVRKLTPKAHLKPGQLQEVIEYRKTHTLKETGEYFGVDQSTVHYFLRRNGVDNKQFRKHRNKRTGPDVPSRRQEAIARGEKRYEGNRCNSCGGVLRYASSSVCVECNRIKGSAFKRKEAVSDDEGWPEPVKHEKTPRSTRNERAEAIASLLAAIPDEMDEKSKGKIKRADIPRILKLLESNSLPVVATRIGVSRNTIDNSLKRYGIDYRSLPPARQATEISTNLDPIIPGMKFKLVQGKTEWGKPTEVFVPQPIGTKVDSATGKTVTTYPPGYAIGAGPQKNVYVKGG